MKERINKKINISDIYNILPEKIINKKIMKKDEAVAWTYALGDIYESISRIYLKIIPKMLSDQCEDIEQIKDAIWDVREEFRHIQYHINDGKLTE